MSRHPPLPPPPPHQQDLFAPATTFYSPSSRPSTRDSTTGTTPGFGGAFGGPGSGGGGGRAPGDPNPPMPALTQSLSATGIPASTSQVSSSRDRKPTFSRKSASFSAPRRKGSTAASNPYLPGGASNSSASTIGTITSNAIVTNAAAPPALPDYALSAAAKVAPSPLTISTATMPNSQQQPPTARDRDRGERDFDLIRSPTSEDSFGRMLSRTATTASMAPPLPPPTPVGGASGGAFWQPGEMGSIHQHIVALSNKRISTFDYLRKVHEGRVHWFNAYLFDRPDLNRMPSFDSRKLSRKATNYLLLGLSLPVIIDLYSSSPLDFLRSLNSLLSEFDSFQQLRSESSTSASLARARLPNMFRRPGGKGRRSTSAADTMGNATDAMYAAGGGNGSAGGGNGGANMSASVRNFAAYESDLLAGEEYTYLLTPALPFEPDYFETFATLCDVFIECYSRLLSLISSPRDCNASVAELFAKADGKIRKIIVQNIAKEFEDSSRANIKTEMAGIGKAVLSGLM